MYNDLILYMVCAYLDNDLDGEALAAAIDEGHDSLKELFPSLSHRLKIFGALKLLRKSHEDSEPEEKRRLEVISKLNFALAAASYNSSTLLIFVIRKPSLLVIMPFLSLRMMTVSWIQ